LVRAGGDHDLLFELPRRLGEHARVHRPVAAREARSLLVAQELRQLEVVVVGGRVLVVELAVALELSAQMCVLGLRGGEAGGVPAFNGGPFNGGGYSGGRGRCGGWPRTPPSFCPSRPRRT